MLENATPYQVRLVPRSGLGTTLGQTPEVLLSSSRLRLAEEPFMLIYSLRRSRRSTDHAAIDAWLRAQQVSPPADANGLSGSPELGCCWLEPNAWLVTSQRSVQVVAPVTGMMVTEISDRLAAFRLTGPTAREALSAGFDPAPLRKGRAMRTRLGSVATVLVQQWDESDYRLLVDVSLARACADWLRENGKVIAAV